MDYFPNSKKLLSNSNFHSLRGSPSPFNSHFSFQFLDRYNLHTWPSNGPHISTSKPHPRVCSRSRYTYNRSRDGQKENRNTKPAFHCVLLNPCRHAIDANFTNFSSKSSDQSQPFDARLSSYVLPTSRQSYGHYAL